MKRRRDQRAERNADAYASSKSFKSNSGESLRDLEISNARNADASIDDDTVAALQLTSLRGKDEWYVMSRIYESAVNEAYRRDRNNRNVNVDNENNRDAIASNREIDAIAVALAKRFASTKIASDTLNVLSNVLSEHTSNRTIDGDESFARSVTSTGAIEPKKQKQSMSLSPTYPRRESTFSWRELNDPVTNSYNRCSNGIVVVRNAIESTWLIDVECPVVAKRPQSVRTLQTLCNNARESCNSRNNIVSLQSAECFVQTSRSALLLDRLMSTMYSHRYRPVTCETVNGSYVIAIELVNNVVGLYKTRLEETFARYIEVTDALKRERDRCRALHRLKRDLRTVDEVVSALTTQLAIVHRDSDNQISLALNGLHERLNATANAQRKSRRDILERARSKLQRATRRHDEAISKIARLFDSSSLVSSNAVACFDETNVSADTVADDTADIDANVDVATLLSRVLTNDTFATVANSIRDHTDAVRQTVDEVVVAVVPLSSDTRSTTSSNEFTCDFECSNAYVDRTKRAIEFARSSRSTLRCLRCYESCVKAANALEEELNVAGELSICCEQSRAALRIRRSFVSDVNNYAQWFERVAYRSPDTIDSLSRLCSTQRTYKRREEDLRSRISSYRSLLNDLSQLRNNGYWIVAAILSFSLYIGSDLEYETFASIVNGISYVKQRSDESRRNVEAATRAFNVVRRLSRDERSGEYCLMDKVLGYAALCALSKRRDA